jgi:hypothetical protein
MWGAEPPDRNYHTLRSLLFVPTVHGDLPRLTIM